MCLSLGAREPGSLSVLETVPHVACQLGVLGPAPAMQQCLFWHHSPLLGTHSTVGGSQVCVLLPTGSEQLSAGTEATLGTPGINAFTRIWPGLLFKAYLEHQGA